MYILKEILVFPLVRLMFLIRIKNGGNILTKVS